MSSGKKRFPFVRFLSDCIAETINLIFVALLQIFSRISDLVSTHYVKLYLIIYHEAVLVGLLEKAFYHASAVASGSELLSELADYCYRKTVYLNTLNFDDPPESRGLSAEEILNQTDADRLKEQQNRLEFSCAISALTIVRFISENASSIPISALNRLLVEQDIIQTLIPLLDHKPWSRYHKVQLQRYIDGRWTDVPTEDLHRVCKTEAQVWLLLNNLLLDRDCRSKYTWTEHTRNSVMRLSKYFNELLIDQLPVLSQLRRFVETLAFAPPPASSEPRAIVIEQVSQVRAGMMSADFAAIAADFRRRVRWAIRAAATRFLCSRRRDMRCL